MSGRRFPLPFLTGFIKSGIVKADQPGPRDRSDRDPPPPQNVHYRPERNDDAFSDLISAYKSCKTLALSPQFSDQHSTRPHAWVKIIDRRIEDLQSAREQWAVRYSEDAARWDSVLRDQDRHVVSKSEAMARQIRRLRQLCTGDMAKLAKRFDLVDRAYSSDRKESYDERIRRVLDDAFLQYLRAHDEMRQKQWEAAISSEVHIEPKARETKRETKKKGEAVGDSRKRVSADGPRRNAGWYKWYKKVKNM